MAATPPRLHVLLAREAATAVIIRRGPSRWFCTIGWDRTDGSFTVGQWLHGRIYERRCDLSPDGRHLIYFAMRGGYDPEAEAPYAYTAISRAPYLKALALYPQDSTWLGGGLFTSNTNYWLNSGCTEAARNETGLLPDCDYVPCRDYGAECPSVYYIRLQRDGWTYLYPEAFRRSGGTATGDVFEKPLPHGWMLHKIAHAGPSGPGHGCYWDCHELIHHERGELDEHRDWEWAEWDGRRLYWAAAGQLWAGQVGPEGLADPQTLHDFNDMTFEPRAAPY